MNPRSELLQEAESLVNGDRNQQYGDPNADFALTAYFWEGYLKRVIEKRGELKLAPHDVALMMDLLKTSRLTWSPEKRDSWVDKAGYTACGWHCVSTDQDIKGKEPVKYTVEYNTEFKEFLFTGGPYPLTFPLNSLRIVENFTRFFDSFNLEDYQRNFILEKLNENPRD